jgi:predicted DNA-binding transcriptional regulator YafY
MLSGRSTLDAKTITGRLGISRRTLNRDIAALSSAGQPVLTLSGEGYTLLEGAALPPVSFSLEEALALFLTAEKASRTARGRLGLVLSRAVEKIESALPEPTRERWRRDRADILLPAASPLWRDLYAAPLADLRRAIVEHRVVVLRYGSPSGEVENAAVEPLGMARVRGRDRLVAYCRARRRRRTFQIDRVRSVEVADETFVPRET